MMPDTSIPSENRSDTRQTTAHSTTQPPHAQTPNAPQEHIIEFTDEDGTRRRIRYVARTDDWWRIEEEWTGCLWRVVGCELITDLQRWSRSVAGECDG
jgi:hypothetical protein